MKGVANGKIHGDVSRTPSSHYCPAGWAAGVMDVHVSAFTCWRIVRAGSFGLVLKADWHEEGQGTRSVIIKAPNPHALRSASTSRLLTEAAVQATCEHECIVRCLGTVQLPVSLLEELAGISPQQPPPTSSQHQQLHLQESLATGEEPASAAAAGSSRASSCCPAGPVVGASDTPGLVEGQKAPGAAPTTAQSAQQCRSAAADSSWVATSSAPRPLATAAADGSGDEPPPAAPLGVAAAAASGPSPTAGAAAAAAAAGHSDTADSSPAPTVTVLGLIQEYMEAGSLYDMLLLAQAAAAYTPRQALSWLLRLARALSYLHSATPRIIHRDIKPENVLLSQVSSADGQLQAKLTDFGLCAMLHPTQDSKLCVRRLLSSSCGSHLGTADASTAASGEGAAVPAAQLQEQQLDVTKLAPSMGCGTDQVVGVLRQQLGVADDLLQQQDRTGRGTEVDKQLVRDVPGQAPDPCSPQQQQPPLEPIEEELTRMRLTGGCGSILYMAPEVYSHRPYTQAVDVFSWAMLAWELLTGQLLSSWVVEHTIEGCRAYRAALEGGWRPSWPPELAGRATGACCALGGDCQQAGEGGGAGPRGAPGGSCSAKGASASTSAAAGAQPVSGGSPTTSRSSSDSRTTTDPQAAAAPESPTTGAAEGSLLADAIQQGLQLDPRPAAVAMAAPPASEVAGGGAKAERVRSQLLQQVVHLVERCWCGAAEERPGMGEVATVLQHALMVLQLAEDAAAAAAGGAAGADGRSIAASVSSYRSSTSGLQASSPAVGGRVGGRVASYSRSSTQQLATGSSLVRGRTLGGGSGSSDTSVAQGRCCLQ